MVVPLPACVNPPLPEMALATVTALLRLTTSVPLSITALVVPRVPVVPPLPNCRMAPAAMAVASAALTRALSAARTNVPPSTDRSICGVPDCAPIRPAMVSAPEPAFWSAMLRVVCPRNNPLNVVLVACVTRTTRVAAVAPQSLRMVP